MRANDFLNQPIDYYIKTTKDLLEPAPIPAHVGNSAPVANAGADQSTLVGNTVTLDGSGSNDADGDLYLADLEAAGVSHNHNGERDGGTTGTLGSGGVTNKSALVFDRSNTITVSKDLSGAGLLAEYAYFRQVWFEAIKSFGYARQGDGICERGPFRDL